MTDFLIVANGCFLVKEIIQEAAIRKTIVALDGAADRLYRIGITADVIVGDFDSIQAPELHPHAVMVKDSNQDQTDLIKAIHYCDKQQASSITLVCATGGRMDHHEGVLRSLRTEYHSLRPLFLHTEQQTLRYLKDDIITIQGEVNDKCGVIAYPAGGFTSSGLVYEGTEYALEFGYRESICNSLSQSVATIKIVGEALLIMPPQLSSQRRFMQLSEVEQLQQQLRDVCGTMTT